MVSYASFSDAALVKMYAGDVAFTVFGDDQLNCKWKFKRTYLQKTRLQSPFETNIPLSGKILDLETTACIYT